MKTLKMSDAPEYSTTPLEEEEEENFDFIDTFINDLLKAQTNGKFFFIIFTEKKY
jgi:hypothetical protein